METIVTLSATGTTATIPGTRLALGYAAWERRVAPALRGVGTVDELHIVPGDEALSALDSELRDAAVTLGSLVAGTRCAVLLPGEGVDGCDVWAVARVES